MADETTKLEDIIQPELFTQYVLERTTEKSELISSGAVQNNPQLDILVRGGGTVLTMPKWNALGGESQVFSDADDIETDKITSSKELATLLLRAKGWSAHDLAGALAGDDPMNRIVEQVATWWANDEKKNVISILKGVFACTGMKDHILDISKEATGAGISATSILDAKQLMGDNDSELALIYMHSAVFTELQKQQLISNVFPSDAKIAIPTYLGYRVVKDDSAPVSVEDGVFTTYLLADGAIQRGVGTPVDLVPTEIERNAKKSTTVLYNRSAKVLHPKGMSWIGSANITKETPSNEELAVGANWATASDLKNIGMVALVHKI